MQKEPPVPRTHIGNFTEEDDPVVEPGLGDPLEQPLMELSVLRGRSPPTITDRPVRAVGKKAKSSRRRKRIGPFLRTDAAEAADGVSTGKTGALQEGFGPGRGMKPPAVHPVHDNGVRHLQEPARATARRDTRRPCAG